MQSPAGIALCAALLLSSAPAIAGSEGIAECSWNGIALHGDVAVVDSFPDIKVQVVDSFPDLKVQVVGSFPDDCGQWKMVDSFPDFTIQFVDSFPDIKIQYVESWPGVD